MKEVKKSKRPVILYLEGKAVVVQDAEAYQRLLDIGATPRAYSRPFAKGFTTQPRGHTKPARDVVEEIRPPHGHTSLNSTAVPPAI